MCVTDLLSHPDLEPMIFIETPAFTADMKELLPDHSYAELQRELIARPRAGDLIPGTGGLRKIRWKLPGQGKRGGARVIYYLRASQSQIWLLAIYGKGIKNDLTAAEKKRMRLFVEHWS